MASFKVHGTYFEEGGMWYAISSDNRFLTCGSSQTDAYEQMKDILNGLEELAKEHNFDPSVPLKKPDWVMAL